MGDDLNLDMHIDDADVTLNLCLHDEFEGYGLTFCGLQGQKDLKKKAHTVKAGQCSMPEGEGRMLTCWRPGSVTT